MTDATSAKKYNSPVRAAAAAAKRDRVIEVARRLLREQPVPSVTLETVAREAGVTRLTVYNQFGSRRGLLEAVLDRVARDAELDRLYPVIAQADGRAGVTHMVNVFCAFWASDPALYTLHQAMAFDAEFGDALRLRNERRRQGLATLVARCAPQPPDARAIAQAVDLIFTLTSCATFTSLNQGRAVEETTAIIQGAVQDALARLERGGA